MSLSRMMRAPRQDQFGQKALAGRLWGEGVPVSARTWGLSLNGYNDTGPFIMVCIVIWVRLQVSPHVGNSNLEQLPFRVLCLRIPTCIS